MSNNLLICQQDTSFAALTTASSFYLFNLSVASKKQNKQSLVGKNDTRTRSIMKEQAKKQN